ncbi:MAG: FAD-dependent oxidoreductase [Holosporaceae bacterium]|nr:FAD-dependent oxidoreductase [Holosporaceae bacterium]
MNKPFATVLGASTSLSNKTGSWRTMCPNFANKLPPCNATCPAGENIQLWLSLAKEEQFHEAWKVMTQSNPFPAIMGRVCYYTCEKACNREQFDGAVNINLIEKSIGDIAIANHWKFENVSPNSGKKVLIVGAGPSGLSAAYFLKMLGHDVTIFENHIKPGGMMRYGIPRYRLSNSIINAEIKRIEDLGVQIICNKRVSNILNEIKGFDATYISIGACLATPVDLETKESPDIVNAIDLFKELEDGKNRPSYLEKKVIIYGGGNTAIDAARTALRLGAKNVKIIYRRGINNMPAHEVEIKEALTEGIEILCLRTINSINSDNILVDKMNYDEKLDVLSKSGETETIYADSVIFAIGQSVDISVLQEVKSIEISEKGTIKVDKNMMTGEKGIFAGGDAILGKRTVTNAIGHAKKAAKCIDAYLRGVEFVPNIKNKVINFKKLNTAYFPKDNRITVSRMPDLSFDERDVSYSDQKIIVESARCFSCGNCFHCDNCYAYCPDNAIIKHSDGSLEINYDYCKGCGMCAAECPCGAIEMISDDSKV